MNVNATEAIIQEFCRVQIALEKPTPVFATNVPDVFFAESSEPLFEGVEDDYIAEYVANVCHARDVHVKLVVCSSDSVEVHIDGRRVRRPEHPTTPCTASMRGLHARGGRQIHKRQSYK